MATFKRIAKFFQGFYVLFLLHLLVHMNNGLNITKMTAPLIADPREDMQLQCHFNMGPEELFAVKWYKDDHEFFRYRPSMKPNTLKFHVPGVQVVPDSHMTQCRNDRCDLLLTNLTRQLSTGEYRCEVSSEAPAFRIAVRTQNVTVAALPKERPRIEDLLSSYEVGDYLIARCISAAADPKPHLAFYINKQQVPTKYVKEIPNPLEPRYPPPNSLNLQSREVQLRLQLERRHSATDGLMEVACNQTLPDLPQEAAPALASTKTALLVDHNYINNQKLHWPSSFSGCERVQAGAVLVLATCARWCWRLW